MAFDRESALCAQTALTGIDFVQVVEPQLQTVLRVFFMVEPSTLDVPMVDGSLLGAPPSGQAAGPLLPETGLGISIVSDETGGEVRVEALGWRRVRAPAGIRIALEIAVDAPGDFSIHRLDLADARVDPFFNNRAFSFKQGCPSVFDCRQPCEADPAEGVDYPVDYLARDFHSFRRALLDFAAERYPGWSEPIEADQAVMLIEIMAALGDEFAYAQDRIARELTIETASQRRSRSGLARLVDYVPDPGRAAETELAVMVRSGLGGASPAAGARVWALPEGRPPIPFSFRARSQDGTVWHHEAWNALKLHQPDSDIACLPAGATHAFLVTTAPIAAQLPPGTTETPEQYWQGRRAILRSRPGPGEPARAFAVTIARVAHLIDSLPPGGPIAITRIDWKESTPWPLRLDATEALLNVVTVVAGERREEYFRIGPGEGAQARPPLLSADEVRALPQAVERNGPFDADRSARGRVLRYSLRGSEEFGLGWEGPRDPLGIGTRSAQRPMLQVEEVPLPLAPPSAPWAFLRNLLEADLDTPAFTLEEGMWRTVVTHQTPFEDVPFQDYSGDSGWTLRFGDGAFGRPPEPGTVFRVAYFTGPGSAANLPSDTLVHLGPPPGAPPGTGFTYAAAATNPLPIASGTDEESPADIRISAPEAWRALPLRAVRPEDYRAIVERLGWVQRANATTAWTGSWSADFIAADPLNGVRYQSVERAALEAVVECVRLATRDARVVDPDYLDIDVEVEVCIAARAYAGQVLPRIIKTLSPPGLFAGRNFSFGEPLRRSALEAAIQAVPGVHGIERIRIRVRRGGDWEPFLLPEIRVAPGQIIRMENDPLFPGRGSLRVTGHGGAE